jgi:CRISPR system Cascade subunit CasC
MVADEIRKLDGAVDAEAAAQEVLKAAGLNIKSADKGTDALFFISTAQARELAKLVVENPKPGVKESQLALRLNPGIDIALFGRMVADDPTLNTDACAQVAHSISTHKVSNEYDYFTAVDDFSSEDSAGAGHIGTVEFNSSTLYRYATVAVHELYKQLAGDTADAVCEFVRAFICSMPTGKQNTFANRTLPDAVLVALRADQPVNLVGAFERPVPAGDEGYVTASTMRLVSHAEGVYRNYGGEPVLSLVNSELLSALGSVYPLNTLLDKLSDELRKYPGTGREER